MTVLIHIVEVKFCGGYRLFLRFEDGAQGEVDVATIVPFDGVFARLKDQAEFDKVYLDRDWGTICWPGDLDLAPETLYERITGRNPILDKARNVS